MKCLNWSFLFCVFHFVGCNDSGWFDAAVGHKHQKYIEQGALLANHSPLTFGFTLLVPILQVSESFFDHCRNLLENKLLKLWVGDQEPPQEPVNYLRTEEIIWNIYHRNISDALWLLHKQKRAALKKNVQNFKIYVLQALYLVLNKMKTSNYVSFIKTVILIAVKAMSS